MGISTPGIGSGLDVESIISKLMAVEARPLASYDQKTQKLQTQISAYGSLSGALSSFQSALTNVGSRDSYTTLKSSSSDNDVLTGSAAAGTAPGSYQVNVTRLAQAQSLISAGLASSTTTIGTGISTRISFSLGTVSGGNFGLAGSALSAAVASGGIATGSLKINGTAIATDTSTTSAKLLAAAVNAKADTTGVTATAATTTSATLFGSGGATTFGDVDTTGGGTYSLTVGGVEIAAQATGVAAGAGVNAASIDATLAGANATTTALAAAGITFTGTAAGGDLQFKNADGSTLTVAEGVTGSVLGGIATDAVTVNAGSSTAAYGALTLSSTNGSPITVAGTDPTLAGLTAGTGGAYLDAAFSQSGTGSSGSIVIDSTNNTLAGIRDAINKANFGVTATIVSDGSATPAHLVLSSSKTGVASTLKISLTGSSGGGSDPALDALLGYDPAGTQNLRQTAAAQDSELTVNGITVNSHDTTVKDAIEGVTLTLAGTGTAKLNVTKDSSNVKSNVDAFVKAYNDLNKAIKDLTSYNPDTKAAGPLLGDTTVRNLQASVRQLLGGAVKNLTGPFKTLSDIGVSFQKDGTLATNSAKLQKAIDGNLNDIVGVFAALGNSTDANISFNASTTATVPGEYAVKITQLATQGTYTGTVALGGATVIAADTKWTVKLDDTDPSSSSNSATVTIAAGTYTNDELTTAIQSAINSASAFSSAGKSVTVSVDGSGQLVVTSAKYGSVSNVSLATISGTGVDSVFGAGSAAAKGLDVAGTLGGFAATGSGQFLTGETGSPVEGLKLLVEGSTTGDRGKINFSQGYGYQLGKLADTFLGSDGLIQGKTDGLNKTVKDIGNQKDKFANTLADIEKRYRAQYTALDTAIASLNKTQSFLTQQFAALSKSTN